MGLPINLPADQLQARWKSQIDPVLANLLVQGRIIQDVSLVAGSVTINHKLGRKLVGWMIVGINAAATVHDAQATNPAPDSTLTLVSSAPAVATLWVF